MAQRVAYCDYSAPATGGGTPVDFSSLCKRICRAASQLLREHDPPLNGGKARHGHHAVRCRAECRNVF
jgi:hypothetical protein